MEKYKISVIVPAYNIESYIIRCLESIINQTYKNLEIIVVNDGSSDNTGIIINKYIKKYSNIKVIHKNNEGVTYARMEGIKNSSGDYIGFVDGDDIIEKDMFEFLMKNILKYNACISHCGYKMKFSDGRINEFYNTSKIIVQNNEQGVKDLLLGAIVEPGLWNKLYKRELFYNLTIDKNIKINEDLLMNYYLFKKSERSIFEDKSKYVYIIRENSASRSELNYNKIYDPIKVKKIIMEDCERKCIQSITKAAYISTNINTYNALIINNQKKFTIDKNIIRENIIKEKDYLNKLCKKQRLLGQMIVRIPRGYKIIYRIYEKNFQKKKYS